MHKSQSNIVIYSDPDGSVTLNVRLQGETVWLNLNELASLFGRDKSVISRHLRNIYQTGELDHDSTVAFFATVQNEGGRRIQRQIEYFNLDAIISVGYRVNSMRGTQFRIWATSVLRDHLVHGYTVNERRLKELNQAIRLIADVAERRMLTGDEAAALIRVVADYSQALDLLDAYDRQSVAVPSGSPSPTADITLEEARKIVTQLRQHYQAGSLFGLERENGLSGPLHAVTQTFDGKDLYPTMEEKAAHLLYFLVKDHPFVDGNKRIAAALFLWFLQKNDALYLQGGIKRISDNALVAMALLIAESAPEEKELLVRVLMHLIQMS